MARNTLFRNQYINNKRHLMLICTIMGTKHMHPSSHPRCAEMQEVACLQCGSRSQAPSREVSHRSVEEEIEFINRESERLDDHIRQLCEKRAQLRRRLNDIQSSARVLPPETLSIIFQHACASSNAPSPIEYRRQINVSPLIRFGAVCSLWRQTVWSTPALWTTIIADVCLKTAKSNVAILDICFRNVGTLPLSLDLCFLEEDLLSWGDTPIPIQPITDLVFNRENAEKVRSLRLQDPPRGWIRLLSNGGFENLEVFQLKGVTSAVNGLNITLPNLPGVHRLSVGDMWHNITIPSADTITTLDLPNTSIGVGVGIFIQCTNLIECHFHVDNPDFTIEGAAINSPVTFSRLTRLTWPFSVGRSNESLFRHIRLPVLQQLRLSCPLRDSFPPATLDALQGFLSRLPSTLSVLELDRWSCPGDNIRRLFMQLPSSIKELSLIDCFQSFTPNLLRALTPEQGGVNSLPILEKLYMSSVLKACLPFIVEMVERRQGGANPQLELVLPQPIGGHSAVAERLEALARVQGRQFKLTYIESKSRL